MKITVLLDNKNSNPNAVAEKGLSLLIEERLTKIIFDTGRHDAFLRNAIALGVNLQDTTHVILSHGHHDHCGGVCILGEHLRTFNHTKAPLLLAHPDIFSKRGLYFSLFGHHFMWRNLGSPVSREQAEKHFRCVLHREPFWIHANLVFLGQIPGRESLQKRLALGSIIKNGRLTKDLIDDDSAIVYKTKSGLVVIAGCAHSGICNIIEYAKQVTQEKKVYAVIGGFHLRSANKQTIRRVADYFQRHEIQIVHGCHCTGRAAHWLPNQINIQTGSVIEIHSDQPTESAL